MILKNHKGSVLVEFALVFPIRIVLIYAVQDFSNYISYSKSIEKIAKNTVNLPVKLKQIYDTENPTDLKNYDSINCKNMLLALINASKLIFYTYSRDMTQQNFPKLVLCWTLIKSSKVQDSYNIKICWRVFLKLTKDAIENNKIQFHTENIDVEKNLTYQNTPNNFKDYNSLINFSEMYKLQYKIPTREGYLLVLEIFDNDLQNKQLYFANFYPDFFFKFHKIAYQYLQSDQINEDITTNIEELENEN